MSTQPKPTAAALLPVLTALGVTATAATYCMDYLTGAKKPLDESVCQHTDRGAGSHQLITLTEAGKRLGYSRTSVWRLVKEGKLPVVNLRGINRIRLADVIALTESKEG